MRSFEPVLAIAASRRVLIGRDVRCDMDTGGSGQGCCLAVPWPQFGHSYRC
jgi:hypothetical protein